MRFAIVFASVDFGEGSDVELTDEVRQVLIEQTHAAIRAALAPGWGLAPHVTVAIGEPQLPSL